MDSHTRINSHRAYATGRAAVPGTTTPDREAMLGEDMSLTDWLVEYWTRQADAQLDAIHTDIYELADRVHYLGVMTLVTLITVVVGLTGALVAMLV